MEFPIPSGAEVTRAAEKGLRTRADVAPACP
jgi:hypothetical protein